MTEITAPCRLAQALFKESSGRLLRRRGRNIKSGLLVFFAVVELTELNERTALGFAVQVAVTQ